MRDKISENGMSLIVKTATRWLKRFILLFGVYIVLYGHLTPGGGFAGGVIIACVFALLTLAEGQRVGMKTLSKPVGAILASIGALIFLGTALGGIALKGVFFGNLIDASTGRHAGLLSGGSIQICEIGIGLIVGTSLYVVFTIMAATRVMVKGGKRKVVQRENK